MIIQGRSVRWRAAILAGMLAGMAASACADDRSLYDWRQRPGALMPLDTTLHDETGQALPLRRLFHGVPVILDLGYFACPSLCGVVRADLLDALGRSGLHAGADVEVAALSIDARETAADAAAARARDVAASARRDASGLHYLVAAQDAIDAIAAAAGFHANYDPRYRQFLHPAGLVVLTGSGAVSSYLLGVGYAPGDLRAAVLRARSGGIARAALPVLLLCFHYDPITGRYTLAIVRLLRLAAVLTVLTIGGLLALLHRRRPRRA